LVPTVYKDSARGHADRQVVAMLAETVPPTSILVGIVEGLRNVAHFNVSKASCVDLSVVFFISVSVCPCIVNIYVNGIVIVL
jgi:hypothetical protein